MIIFTLGTADRPHFEFTKILSKYRIQVLLDIRPSPASPQAPQFNRDSLQRLCADQGAEYIYLGNDLTDRRSTELRPSSRNHPDYQVRLRYQERLASEGTRRVIAIAAHKAQTRVTCFLCSERTPEDCCRLLLAQELGRLGFTPSHILDENTLWAPPPARRPAALSRHSRPRRRFPFPQ